MLVAQEGFDHLPRGIPIERAARDNRVVRIKRELGLAAPPAPLLILQGTDDEITFYPIFERIAERADASVRIETFQGARHVKMLTNPDHRERYVRVVTDFLRGSASGARPATQAPNPRRRPTRLPW